MKVLYYSFVYSRLNLHILAWGGSSVNVLRSLYVAINNVIRNVGYSLNTGRAAALYNNLRILNFDQLYKLKLLQFMFNAVNGRSILLPDFLGDARWSHIYNTRQASLRLPASRVNVNTQFPIGNAIKLWSVLPLPIKNSSSNRSFKKSVIKLITDNML